MCPILQNVLLDSLETIAVLHVPIQVLEHSVMKHVVARGYHVIIPMDAMSQHQVPRVKILMFYFLAFFSHFFYFTPYKKLQNNAGALFQGFKHKHKQTKK